MMFLKTAILFSMLVPAILCHGQTDTTLKWTWVKGDNFPSGTYHYGVKGQESPLNQPPSRKGALSWTDTSGYLWLFGGAKLPGITLNDLWRFNTNNSQWAWISGDSIPNQYGVHGVMGQASSLNKPAARYNAAGWTSPDNQLWLYGGDFTYSQTQYGMWGDLWKFDIASGEWTWVKGSNQPDPHAFFGTKGVSSPLNDPGAVSLANAWTDLQGRFWLFGGFAFRESGPVAMESNKLWRYDPQTNNWTWMKGDANSFGEHFGTQHVQAAANNPGGRLKATTWTDRYGNLWLFGGAFVQGRQMNDLWKYDIVTNNWVWEKGLPPPDLLTIYWPAVYGIKDSAQDSNNPGGRQGAIGWTDGNDRLWLFGGLGTVTEHALGDLNDLWSYDLQTGMWTWIKGDSLINAPGHYGMQGIADSLNEPRGREQAVAWKDKQGNNWLFGGSYFLNDLWKISSSRFDPLMHLSFQGYVAGQANQIEWDTDIEAHTSYFLLERSSDRVQFDSLVRITAAGNSSSARHYAYLDTHPLPDTNYYRLKVVYSNAYHFYSDTIAVIRSATAIPDLPFPNPAHDVVQVPIPSGSGVIHIRVFDAAGKELIRQTISNNSGACYALDISHLPAGVYFIRVRQQGYTRVQRLLKL